MLINRKAVKQLALDCAQQREHKFTRVSKEFCEHIDAKVKDMVKAHVASLPSVGKTIL